MRKYKEYFDNQDFSQEDFLDGDILLLDDVMTTGTTVKAIHENLAGYKHENKEGSKTSGSISDTSKKVIKGKLHTLALLKNY